MQNQTSIKSIIEFKRLYGKSEGFIVDIRSTEDFGKGHMPQALNLDLMSQGFVEYFSELNRNTEVFLYCSDGSRSKVAVKVLSEMGFEHLFNLKNGINQWEGIHLL